MSCGENIRVSYFSAILAKALKQNDGDQFIEYYDLICKRATEDEVEEAKENARNFSNLPLPTLIHKISWLEKLGVKPLHLPEKEELHPKMTTALPKKEISSTENAFVAHLSEPLFEDDNASIDEKFFFAKSNDVGFHGETSLVELSSRMASRKPAQKELNLAFIDADAEDVVSDDPLSPVATQETKVQNQDNDSAKKSGRQNKFVQSSSEFAAGQKSQDCVIDMSGVEEQIENSTKFFSSIGTEPEDSNAMKLMEMKDFKKSDIDCDVQHAGVKMEDNHVGVKKAVKRKKKSKTKGSGDQQKGVTANFVDKKQENNALGSFHDKSGESSFSERQKNVQFYHPINSEAQPLLGGDSKYNGGQSTERPVKKMTIKRYQAQKKLCGNLVSEPKYGSQGTTPISKAKQREIEEEKKKNLLPPEEINEILRKLGDPSFVEISTKNKKKSKENKHTVPKKSKKKTKKQKKVEKPKDKKDPEELEPNKNSQPVLVNEVQEDSLLLAPISVADVEDDNKEFVVPKKRKGGTHKQAASGCASSKNIAATTKRRFSDPSPTVGDNGQASTQSQRSKGQDGSSQNQDNVPPSSNSLFDRESRSQWPTLPLLADPSCCKSVSGHSAASYASKLKSNLDSTGCSLASSSEDGSSTSSSSPNNCISSSAGYMNSVNECHVSVLANMPLLIEAAAAHMVKTLDPLNGHNGPQTDLPLPPMKLSLTELKPVHIVDQIVHDEKDDKNRDVAKTGAKVQNDLEAKVNSSGSLAAKFDEQSKADKSNCGASAQADLHCPAAQEKVEINMNGPKDLVDESDDIIFTADSGDRQLSDIQVLSELENEWGLNFFTQDFSMDDFDESHPNNVMAKPSETDGIELIEVSFGDDKLLSDEVDSKSTVDKSTSALEPSTDNVLLLLPRMRICDKLTKWNDPGLFELREAVDKLLQEWNNAVNEGKHYQE